MTEPEPSSVVIEHNRRLITRDDVTDWTEDFFTRPETIAQCVEIASKYVKDFPHLVYIDSSAGKNEFATELCAANSNVGYLSFDIKLYPERVGNVTQKDWLTVEASELPDSTSTTSIAIGFNPPFGRRNDMLNAFMVKACSFQPKFLFLLCPGRYELPKQDRPWYDQVEKLDLLPFAFYRSSLGLNASKYHMANQFHICKFVVLQRRETPKEITRAPVATHPAVEIYKLATLDDANQVPDAENVILVRTTGHLSGHSYFFPQADGTFDEYRLNEHKGNWENWAARGYAPSVYTCLHFTDSNHPSREWIRTRFIEEWRRKCPLSFVPNQSSFSINRTEFCEMLRNFL